MCDKKTSTNQNATAATSGTQSGTQTATQSGAQSGTQSGSVTPTLPAWVTQGLQSLGGQITGLSSIDPHSLVAGPDALQTLAGTNAAGLGPNPDFSTASGIFRSVANNGTPMSYTAQHAGPASLLDNLQSYMSPYTDNVVNTTLKGYDQNSNLTRGQQQLDLANDSTFGGSGGSILRALTEGQLAQGRAGTEAQLRDQAFNTGANLSNLDAGRRQETSLFNAGADNTSRQFNAQEGDTALNRMLTAGGMLSNNATASGADARANIGTQSDIGSILRDITQSGNLSPLMLLGAQSGLFSGLPLSLLHGDTTTGNYSGTSNVDSSGTSNVNSSGTSNSTSNGSQTTSDPLGSLASLFSAGGSLFSGLGSLGLFGKK